MYSIIGPWCPSSSTSTLTSTLTPTTLLTPACTNYRFAHPHPMQAVTARLRAPEMRRSFLKTSPRLWLDDRMSMSSQTGHWKLDTGHWTLLFVNPHPSPSGLVSVKGWLRPSPPPPSYEPALSCSRPPWCSSSSSSTRRAAVSALSRSMAWSVPSSPGTSLPECLTIFGRLV